MIFICAIVIKIKHKHEKILKILAKIYRIYSRLDANKYFFFFLQNLIEIEDTNYLDKAHEADGMYGYIIEINSKTSVL